MHHMVLNFSALLTFVIVAKHLSFTKAAKELHLTQGAVSIQIKQLEEDLGFVLFQRETRKIFLTREGKELLDTVDPALRQIQTRIKTIQSKGLDGVLTVSSLPSFASKWLIPRILQFQEKFPTIDLRVHTSAHLVDFINEKVDCAIRFGRGEYPELSVTHIVNEIYFPVCSPDLIKKDYPLKEPEDIKHYRLLHDDYAVDDYFNTTWKKWAKAIGKPDLDVGRGVQYGQSDFVLQAAIAGQGIALARITLVGDDLKAGLLQPLFNSSVQTEYSFYFVCPKAYENMHKVVVFRDWIIKKMQKEIQESKKLLGVNFS